MSELTSEGCTTFFCPGVSYSRFDHSFSLLHFSAMLLTYIATSCYEVKVQLLVLVCRYVLSTLHYE